jgi:ribulose-5-phosphate 4-epimerase/fuculose-1-phosphate aldolase
VTGEGVIQYALHHEARPHGLPAGHPAIVALLAWREVCVALGLVGRDPQREGGIGFGNLSVRWPVAPASPPAAGVTSFVITGSQTGDRAQLAADDLAHVLAADLAQFAVSSSGLVPPSSEALTHAAIYGLDPRIAAVIHGHDPALWRAGCDGRWPTTTASAAYGTPEMAADVQRLHAAEGRPRGALFVLAGHDAGVLSFGDDLDAAGLRLTAAVARARA